MVYLRRAPSPILRPWILAIWYCRASQIAHSRERVLPNGCIEIILHLSRGHLTDCGVDGTASGRIAPAIVSGPRTRFSVVDTADMDDIAGIVIRPGGFAGLFRERADLLFERSIPLDDLWRSPDLIERVCAAASPEQKIDLLDSFLRGLVHERARRLETVDSAMQLFRDLNLSVAACARSIGISDRRLSQVFREEVGLAPKAWLRLCRFQSAVRALHRKADIPWATLALDCGYYDQSHFANDFRAFSGIDPTTYSTRSGQWRNHVALT